MSSRPRKAKEEKRTVTTKTTKAKPTKPSGKAPEATIVSRHGTGSVTRLGRGFSMGELAGAGLSPSLASDWGVRIDLRRRSVLEVNVTSLRSWSAHPATARRVEKLAKEAEEEIQKVGREVKKEAARVEKEAKKVEREVKEEAVKAEKAVRRKPKPKKKAKS